MFFCSKKKSNTLKEISFIWMKNDFIEYDWDLNMNNYPYAISVFETEETSFSSKVMKVFLEIAERITIKHSVVHVVKGGYRKLCTGLDRELINDQIDDKLGWDETQLYSFLDTIKIEEFETVPFELCIMIDMVHANMTIRCKNEVAVNRIRHIITNVVNGNGFELSAWEEVDC